MLEVLNLGQTLAVEVITSSHLMVGTNIRPDFAGRRMGTIRSWDCFSLPQRRKRVDSEDTPPFLDQVYFGCTQRDAHVNNSTVIETVFAELITTSAGVKIEAVKTSHLGATTCKVMLKSESNGIVNEVAHAKFEQS